MTIDQLAGMYMVIIMGIIYAMILIAGVIHAWRNQIDE